MAVKSNEILFRYVFFAVVATTANLATQRLMLLFGDGNLVFILAVGAGTLAGMLLKYLLDKRWIFFDTSSGFRANTKKFSLYTVMGLATTAIFWSTETAFWFVWRTDTMRELGAVIGLSIGYVLKYNLDRRFVFNES